MRSRSGINRRLVVGAVAGAYVCCGIAGIVLESVEVFGATVGAVSAIVSIWAVDLAMRASESGQTTNTPRRRPSNNPGYSRASLTDPCSRLAGGGNGDGGLCGEGDHGIRDAGAPGPPPSALAARGASRPHGPDGGTPSDGVRLGGGPIRLSPARWRRPRPDAAVQWRVLSSAWDLERAYSQGRTYVRWGMEFPCRPIPASRLRCTNVLAPIKAPRLDGGAPVPGGGRFQVVTGWPRGRVPAHLTHGTQTGKPPQTPENRATMRLAN
jgi:hypothetical protein